MDMYIFKVTVFIKQGNICIECPILFPPPRIQHVGWRSSAMMNIFSIKYFQGEEPLDTGGGRVFSLDASSGLLAIQRFGAGTFHSVLSLCAVCTI